jgi:hypothetical protein
MKRIQRTQPTLQYGLARQQSPMAQLPILPLAHLWPEASLSTASEKPTVSLWTPSPPDQNQSHRPPPLSSTRVMRRGQVPFCTLLFVLPIAAPLSSKRHHREPPGQASPSRCPRAPTSPPSRSLVFEPPSTVRRP